MRGYDWYTAALLAAPVLGGAVAVAAVAVQLLHDHLSLRVRRRLAALAALGLVVVLAASVYVQLRHVRCVHEGFADGPLPVECRPL